MARCSFDVFSGDLARAFGSGGALVICPRDILLEPAQLSALIQGARVDCGEFVPAVMRELMRHLHECGQRLGQLSCVIVGSDTWTVAEYRQLTALCAPGALVVNSYGLSEATIDSTYFTGIGSAPALADESSVPIGRAFANTQAYLLDRQLQPVPRGVCGELYIGGAGLARGYLGRADLTAERFVPNPFVPSPFVPSHDAVWVFQHEAHEEYEEHEGCVDQPTQDQPVLAHQSASDRHGAKPTSLKPQASRLYRTGDQARLLPDGQIVFLGRNDRQVKIRGFRVEPTEVQATLNRHPAVMAALVTATTDNTGQAVLAAYLVAEDGQQLAIEPLRVWLRAQLPEYMVPAVFVPLDAMPLSPNGKIDYAALPAPQRPPAPATTLPRDAIELRLVAIWEALLGVAPIGVNDNFFDQGGHSLLAVHLMARIQQHFGRRLPLTVLFQGATVAQLADALRSTPQPSDWSPLVPMQTRGNRRPLFCVPGAGGNVIGFYSLAQRLGNARPIYGLQSRGLDGTTPPHTSIEEMAACYCQAIRTVQPSGPYLLCGHSFGSWVAFEMAQQLRSAGQQVALLAVLNTPTPLVMSGTPDQQEQPWDEATTILNVADTVGRSFGVDLALTREQLAPLSPEAQIGCLTEQLKRTGVLPPEAPTDEVRGFVEVFKTNYAISYTPQHWQALPIALFRASEQHDHDSDVPAPFRDDPAWGWQTFADGPVAIYQTPGEHLTMLAEPQVARLAAQLTAELARREPD